MFERLKITATMGSPTAFIDMVVLDSILAAVAAKELHLDQLTTEDSIMEFDLPLKKGLGYWNASSGFCVGNAGKAVYHKKWDEAHDDIVVTGKSKINVSSGGYKSYSMPLRYIDTPTLTFWAVGIAAQIEKQLSTVTAIGKKRSQGYGQVIGWHVTASFCGEEEIVALRPMPSKTSKKFDFLEYFEKNMRVIPPYWAMKDAVKCTVPIPVVPEVALCCLLQVMQSPGS